LGGSLDIIYKIGWYYRYYFHLGGISDILKPLGGSSAISIVLGGSLDICRKRNDYVKKYKRVK
jgi:hypothetical protein